jgi:iron-sulfur cluster repair protein YtfE (RIC family)
VDARDNRYHPGLPVLSLLRARPLAQETLERLGLNPWIDPRMTLGELCSGKAIPWPELEAMLREIPDSLPQRDWDRAPLPLLLDHLVSDHAEIQGRILPEIHSALALASEHGTVQGRLAYLVGAWPGFTADLAAHMKEEEVFLFPRLLHYDYCVRHRDQHPGFSGGSVNVFIAIHLLGNENRQSDALFRFIGEMEAASRTGPVISEAEAGLLGLVASFQERLKRHNALETAILFPRAKSMEKALYDAAIAGEIDSGHTIPASR